MKPYEFPLPDDLAEWLNETDESIKQETQTAVEMAVKRIRLQKAMEAASEEMWPAAKAMGIETEEDVYRLIS